MDLIQFEGCTVAIIAPEDLEAIETFRVEALRLIQNCVLAGKYQPTSTDPKFWDEVEAWLDRNLNL